MNGTYEDVIVWARNRSPAINQTLAATVKKTAPDYSKVFKLRKKKRISVFQIKAEDKRKISKHLFNRRPNPTAIKAIKLCEN